MDQFHGIAPWDTLAIRDIAVGLGRIRQAMKRASGETPEPAPDLTEQAPSEPLDPPPVLGRIVLSEAVMNRARTEASTPAPWSGTPLEILAKAAAMSERPDGYPEEYDLLQTRFDHAHYYCQRPDVARARLDPVAHYIRAGAAEGIQPAPWFSGDRWEEQHDDMAGLTPFGHWLTHGDGSRDLVSPVPSADPERQSRANEAQAALRSRLETGVLGEMVAKAATFDPLVAQSWTEATAPRIQPVHDSRATARLGAIRNLHEAAGQQSADAVVIVGDPRWGAALRMEGHIAHGLARLSGIDRVAVITTDRAGTLPATKVPEGGVHIDLADAISGLPHPDRRKILVETIRGLAPRIGFAVNSRLFWEAMTEYGTPLCAQTRLFGCMFCNDKDQFGRWGGYPASRFYRHFDQLAGICTDSHALKAELSEQFMIPEAEQDRITVLSAPVDPDIGPVQPADEPSERPQIYWAGRLDPQKRLDIAYAIARAMPEADFRLWGRVVAGGMDPKHGKPENVHLMGSYRAFEDLPLEQADAWLYTSEWDGVPSILLEVAMTGVPIIGSLVGGTGEILGAAGTGGAVMPFDDVAAFADKLRDVIANPDRARSEALELRERLLRGRTEAAYTQTISRLAGGADG